jgi:putative flippase GtrA
MRNNFLALLISYIAKVFRQNPKKFRFLIAGGVNTAVGLLVYPFLYLFLEPFNVGYIKVLFLATIISVTFSFLTNKYYVFKTKGNLKKEYFKFFIFYGLYFSINLICLPLLVEVLKITPIISQTLFSIFIILTSYFWHNYVTFKNSKGII